MAFWTPKEDDILINMVNDHKEVNDIMVVLNKGRDQVAGRIRRLRASGALPEKATQDESTTKSKPKKKKTKAPAKPKEPPFIPVRHLHPLEMLGYDDCRWPIGDPGQTGFRFCGEPIKRGSPYCPVHAVKAFATGRVRELEEAD